MVYSVYKTRMTMQAIVILFVFLSAVAQLGYLTAPSMLLTACATIAAAWLAANRTTWLPFLGPTVMPSGIFKVQQPKDADFSAVLHAPKKAVRCVFWGSVLESNDPYTAYGPYTNAGVADVVNGTATVSLKKPVEYAINGKNLPAHIHYRWISPGGMLSGVRTASV